MVPYTPLVTDCQAHENIDAPQDAERTRQRIVARLRYHVSFNEAAIAPSALLDQLDYASR